MALPNPAGANGLPNAVIRKIIFSSRSKPRYTRPSLQRGSLRCWEILLQVTYSSQKEIVMGDRFSGSIITAAIAAAIASAAISLSVTLTSAQAPAVSGAALKTPWGEPDLQGIWTDEFDTPVQRPAKYANQECFTEAQR